MRVYTEELSVEVAAENEWLSLEQAQRIGDCLYIPFGNGEAIRASAAYKPIRAIVDICVGHRAEIVGEQHYNIQLYNVWLVVTPSTDIHLVVEFPYDQENNLVGDPCAGVDEAVLELTSDERKQILDMVCQIW